MRRHLVWHVLTLVLCGGMATSAAAAPKDDDILGNIGNTPVAKPKPLPATHAATAPSASAEFSNSIPPPPDADNPGVIDRVKSVPRKPLLKRHRFEITPFASLSLNDPYFEHFALSGTAVFYPHDSFGIGIGADYFYTHVQTRNVEEVRQGLTSVLPTFDQPVLLGHVDLYWLPIYGKVSFFDSSIIQFDLYGSAGLGFETAFGSRTPAEVNIAIGQHYVLEEWLALRFEVRDHFFVDQQLANSLPQSSIQSYVMFLAGLSFFIPPTFEYTFQ